jgi:hypothetical protein
VADVRSQAGRAVRSALAVLLIFGRAAVGAVFSGIPVNLRLHRIARSGPVRRARREAEDALRERIAAAAAALSSARLVCVRVEDRVVRERRFAPRIFGRRPAGPAGGGAMRGTVYAAAYFAGGGAMDERELAEGLAGEWRAGGSTWSATSFATWEYDRAGHPVTLPPPRRGRGPEVILHREAVAPPGWSPGDARGPATPTLMRWTSQLTYLTTPRWPLLHRLSHRAAG